MAICHASVNAWLALREQYALQECHSPASRFRLVRCKLRAGEGCWFLQTCCCFRRAVLHGGPNARDVAGCTGGEGVEMRFMSLCSGAMGMQRWLARCWRSACFAASAATFFAMLFEPSLRISGGDARQARKVCYTP